MSSEGPNKQHTSRMTDCEDSARSDLVNAHASNSSETADSRIDGLMNILLGKSAEESWDLTLIKKLDEDNDQQEGYFDGDYEGYWELVIQPSDWNLLVDRGLTWELFQKFINSFVSAYSVDRAIIIGSLYISWQACRDDDLHRSIKIDELYYHRCKNPMTSGEGKNNFDGFAKLLSTSPKVHRCEVHKRLDPVLVQCILEGKFSKTLRFICVENISPQIFEQCCDNPHLVELTFHACSFADVGVAFCQWLRNRKHPIDVLEFEEVDIDASIFASALQRATCVNKLSMGDCRGQFPRDWDSVINSISKMQNLKSIDLRDHFNQFSEFIRWLPVLISNGHLQSIHYNILIEPIERQYDSDEDSDYSDSWEERIQQTEQICSMLKDRPHLIDLRVPASWINKKLWRYQVKPILVGRQAMHLAHKLDRATMKDAASLFGHILCQADRSQLDANAVFRLVLHNTDTVTALWDTGREKRLMALIRTMRKTASRYIEMAGKSDLPDMAWEDGKQYEISVSLQEFSKGSDESAEGDFSISLNKKRKRRQP